MLQDRVSVGGQVVSKEGSDADGASAVGHTSHPIGIDEDQRAAWISPIRRIALKMMQNRLARTCQIYFVENALGKITTLLRHPDHAEAGQGGGGLGIDHRGTLEP